MAGSRDVVGKKKNHQIVCTAKVGKVIEYESSICKTSSDTTIQKSKKVNLPASAVLVIRLVPYYVLPVFHEGDSHYIPSRNHEQIS